MPRRPEQRNAAARGVRRRYAHLTDVILGVMVGLVCVAILMLFAAQAR